ncbi:MAG: aldose 1-epimerase family protein [Oscillospiraceae bacterium]|nr:aldose 1-epimerase family protein [Oscillospiraceae bacterium]
MIYELKNNVLSVCVNSLGAEMKSIKKTADDKELMWHADPAFWGRTSPILFPFVGGTKENTYYYNGQKYSASSHGFARDMEFELKEQTENELWFSLCDTEETRKNYPFSFELNLGYRLNENTVTLMWKVKNTGNEKMHFSIGGHPAFLCDLKTDALIYRLKGEVLNNITSGVLVYGSNVLSTKKINIDLENGIMPLSPSLFDEDALILENAQADEVTIVDKNKKPILTVSFSAPLFGVWSPAGKDAPFVCIEPWYGRCDAADFSQKLEEKAYSTALKPNESFEAEYSVKIH